MNSSIKKEFKKLKINLNIDQMKHQKLKFRKMKSKIKIKKTNKTFNLTLGKLK